jgi:hypothetical protein
MTAAQSPAARLGAHLETMERTFERAGHHFEIFAWRVDGPDIRLQVRAREGGPEGPIVLDNDCPRWVELIVRNPRLVPAGGEEEDLTEVLQELAERFLQIKLDHLASLGLDPCAPSGDVSAAEDAAKRGELAEFHASREGV